MTPFAPPPPLPLAPTRQRGIGILQALLIIVLVGAAVVAGLTLLRAQQPADQAAKQEDALRWADEAIVAYAAANARLPCPVSSPSSAATACVAAGEKGWLPMRALEAVHPGGAGPTQPLRYVVYRGGADSDLAVATNTFSPYKWDRTQHALPDINGLDLCAKLGVAARETHAAPRANLARTVDVSGATVNVAYGLVAAGPTPGAAGRFDGVNQAAGATVAAPSLGSSSDYDDRTRVRDFNGLAQTLGCGFVDPANADGVALAAVDMLALAVDVSDEVNEQHEGNKEDTQLAVVMASVSVVFAGINVALSGASIVNSVSTLATASSQLSAAIASCVVLVGCGLIPPYTAAVIAGSIAVGLATGATVLAAAAVVPTSVALGLTVEARDMAQQGLPSATIDLSSATQRTCLSAEGGFVSQAIDANGQLVTIDPPQFRNGLLQEVQVTEAELTSLRDEAVTTRRRLDELEQVPSVVLIDYPPEPMRLPGESDAVWAARYQAWLDSRRNAETLLQAKLEAIRRAKSAQFAYDSRQQDVVNAENELRDINESVRQLRADVATCDASPPSDIVGTQRCANLRRSLLGLTTCDANILTAAQVRDRQCQPWKQADRDAAVVARENALVAFQNAEDAAAAMPEPPIKDYIPSGSWFSGTWDCAVFAWCDPLIVPYQRDSDKRETYAKLVYRSLGLQSAVTEKQAELDTKRIAYDRAQAQCDALRALRAPGGASGTQAPPVWAGANAIMQAANCRGATGAVQPASCGATP
jgi:hypothetical protein